MTLIVSFLSISLLFKTKSFDLKKQKRYFKKKFVNRYDAGKKIQQKRPNNN